MKAIISIIWLVDVLNISTNINGFDLEIFLDKSIEINTLFWFCYFFIAVPCVILKMGVDKVIEDRV